MAVLDRFHTEEEASTRQRCRQQTHQRPLVAKLCTANGPCHRQATYQQNDRVERSEGGVEVVVGIHENLRVPTSKDGVGDEQAAKKQYFRDQKKPHT